jgi:hypothetical protein
LSDADGVWLAGERPAFESGEALALEFDGQLIGTLHALPLPELESELDLAFARDQRHSALRIAAVIFLVASLVALVLARHWYWPAAWCAPSAAWQPRPDD